MNDLPINIKGRDSSASWWYKYSNQG